VLARRQKSSRKRRARSEAGYMLLAIVILATLMAVALAAGIPKVTQAIKRDREEEMVQRMLQYRRAVQLYYRKFGHNPTSIDQLENSNNIRFLRKRYVDPITGKDDWTLVQYGQCGGQPVESIEGATPASALPSPTPSTGSGTVPGQLGQPNPQQQAFGGGGFVGVTSSSKAEGIKEFAGKKHYNEWGFSSKPALCYDPSQEIIGGQMGVNQNQNLNNGQNTQQQ